MPLYLVRQTSMSKILSKNQILLLKLVNDSFSPGGVAEWLRKAVLVVRM